MSNPPPSLTDLLGGLRAAAAGESARGWLPAALHALIMACLARLFGRLEHIFLLWQSGDLPIPAANRPQGGGSSGVGAGMSGQSANSSSPAARWIAVRASHRDSHGDNPGAENCPCIRARIDMPRAAPPIPAPNFTPSATARGAVRLRSARAPPPRRRPICRKTPHAGQHQRALCITIS